MQPLGVAVLCALLALSVLPSVAAQSADWCPTTSSVIPFPASLTPVTGFADDQCEYFFVASSPVNASASLSKLDQQLNILVQNVNPIPSELAQGYSSIVDFDWNAGILYVPVNGDDGAIILMFDSDTLAYKGASIPLPGVGLFTVVVDDAAGVLYSFGNGGATFQGQFVVVMPLGSLQSFTTVYVDWSQVDSGAIAGAALAQPGVIYVAIQEQLYDGQPLVTYPLNIDATKGGKVNATAVISVLPSNPPVTTGSQASGVANVWLVQGSPNLGVYHAADWYFMYNFQVCTSNERDAQMHTRSSDCTARRRRPAGTIELF